MLRRLIGRNTSSNSPLVQISRKWGTQWILPSVQLFYWKLTLVQDVNLMNSIHIWQRDWRQDCITANFPEDGSIWKTHTRVPGVRKVPCLSQVEESCIQAITLHYKCQCIIKSTLKGWLLHIGSVKALLFCGNTESSSRFQRKALATPTQPTVNSDNAKMHVDLSDHCENEGSAKEKPSHSSKWSLTKEQLQGMPLMKQDIFEVYSDIFIGIGKFPGPPYKFQLKPNVKPARHAPRCIPIHLQEAFHQEIRNLE